MSTGSHRFFGRLRDRYGDKLENIKRKEIIDATKVDFEEIEEYSEQKRGEDLNTNRTRNVILFCGISLLLYLILSWFSETISVAI